MGTAVVPSQCVAAACPMSSVAKGFACHSGALPPRSGIAVLLESPGPDEPVFLVKDLVDGAAEVERRRTQYPELESRWVNVGAPVVGRAGTLMWSWILGPMGLQRSDVAVFNTLHCYPGKDATGAFAYPKGSVRKKAEATCASLWLQGLMAWEPTVSVVAMHPSAISRDVVPLPMVLRAVERAKVFAAKGERVLLLMGGKAAKHWMGYAENTTRWCGHWQRETAYTRARRAERWDFNRRINTMKTPKVKKLTVKIALIGLLSQGKRRENGDGLPASVDFDFTIPAEVFDAMNALLKSKKVSQCDISHEVSTSEITTQVMVPVLK